MTDHQDSQMELPIEKRLKVVESDEEDEQIVDIGPNFSLKPQGTLYILVTTKDLIMDELPISKYYEKSLMHRDTVTFSNYLNLVLVSKINDFIFTCSNDGHLKFWKKAYKTIEFIKHFRAHVGAISSLSLSPSHEYLATVSPQDKQLKVFDVLSYDLSTITALDFQPNICCYFIDPQTNTQKVAISEFGMGAIHIIELFKEKSEKKILKIHQQKVKYIQFNKKYNVVVSLDDNGIIEYWSPSTYDFPKNLKFRTKLDTDLYEMAKVTFQAQNRVSPISFTFSNDFNKFAVEGNDHMIRIYDFLTGKITKCFQSKPQFSDQLLLENNIDKIEYDRRLVYNFRQAVEKEIEKSQEMLASQSLQFDDSDTVIIYTNFLGIQFYDLESDKIIQTSGKSEANERFLSAILYQGKAIKNPSNNALESTKKLIDPLLLCTSFKKSRFFIFSRREPEDQSAINRDIFNEKPSKEDQQNFLNLQNAKQLPNKMMIQTTMGDISIKLFSEDCPRTVENFVTHAEKGYFDNLIFHRVIRNFMIQSGDPIGDGTGGESIWGGEFEDEIRSHLKHDRPFTLSMANAGPNTNGSQFFLTSQPCSWLDGKHTVFGRVFKGMDVVQDIEKVKCDAYDKPLRDIKIKSIIVLK